MVHTDARYAFHHIYLTISLSDGIIDNMWDRYLSRVVTHTLQKRYKV